MSKIEAIIKTRLKKLGPMTVKDFFSFVLYDSDYGYYSKRNILGKKGDFITGPETSQLFGETIAVWLVINANKFYNSKKINLCELGPGRGTLMNDMLRTIKKIDNNLFNKIKKIFFLESAKFFSDNLRNKFIKSQVVNDIGKLPKSRNIIIANEFFDAVPVSQYIFKKNSWHEKLVYINNKRELQFIVSKKKAKPNSFFPKNPIENQVFEFSEYTVNLLIIIFDLLSKFGGLFLIIDYAKKKDDYYGTLSAINNHKHVDPFFELGKTDISFKPDFNLVTKIARQRNCQVHGPISQSRFLQNMGINERVRSLVKSNPNHKNLLLAQLEKLVDSKYMGTTFKVIGISNNKKEKLMGFNE